MNPDFWRGRRVLLTGHTGFKGSWLSLWSQRSGADLTGYALRPPTQPSLFDVAHLSFGMNSIIADVRDANALLTAVRASRPEIVFHMAAQSLVRESYRTPVETFATNVMGTVNLFDAIRTVGGVRAVVNVTTDKCYENRGTSKGFIESDPMGGFDPYSSSKACAELVSAAYRSSFFDPASHAEHGTALATARAGNVIGGGDWAKDRLLPDIVAAFERKKPVLIRNPDSVRPWQHVLEPLRGYLMLAERLHSSGSEYAEPWNFGPTEDDAKPVSWIVENMARVWGDGARWEVDAGHHPHEAGYLRLDISKARARLGWEPIIQIGEACQWVTDWARARLLGADMREFSCRQIKSYQSMTASG